MISPSRRGRLFLNHFRLCGERVLFSDRTLVLLFFVKSFFALAARFFKSFRFCRGTFFAGTPIWFRTLVLFFLNHFRLRGERACCRRRVFLLLRQKKVTKEKATPGSLEIPKENSLAKAPS